MATATSEPRYRPAQPAPLPAPIGGLSKSVGRLGFWSAALVTAWTLWFLAAFAAYLPALPATWPGIDAFAASFQPLPYLAWVVPCLLLALTFPVMMSAVHFATPEERCIWSWLGVMFGAMYGAVLGATYFLLMTVVRSALESGDTQGLTWLVVGSPHSVTNTLEGAGYGLMGLSMLLAGPAFEGGALGRGLRWLLVANGLAGIGGVLGGVLGATLVSWASLPIWGITFPAATILLAVRFRRGARQTAFGGAGR
jgi:hypothetical protein